MLNDKCAGDCYNAAPMLHDPREMPVICKLLTVVALFFLLPLPATAQQDGAGTEDSEAREPAKPMEILEARPVGTLPSIEVDLSGGSDYTIGRQDLLEISVFDLPELDKTVRVADDGSITLPLLGRLIVAGLTKHHLEELLENLLEEKYV